MSEAAIPRRREASRQPISRQRVVAAWAALWLACTNPTPPHIEVRGALSPDEEPRVFLVATREKERIALSLTEARIALADDIVGAPFLLRVTLGSEKASRACGAFANVKYSLRREEHEIFLIVASGWTGSCEPNVFEALSRTLRAQFDGGR